MLAVSAHGQTASETSAADVNTAITDFTKRVEGFTVKDPQALSPDANALLLDSLLKLRALADKNSLELQQARASSLLLERAKIALSKPNWPQAFIDTLLVQANYFDGLLYDREALLAFRRAADTIVSKLPAGALADPLDLAAARKLRQAMDNRLPSPPVVQPNAIDVADAALKQLNSVLKEPEIKALIEDATVRRQLTELRARLAVFEKRDQQRVHVLGALYGDIHAINWAVKAGISKPSRRDRWCIASANAAKSCERKANCTLEFDNFSKDICSFDPAEFLEPRFKAVVVWYVCRTNANEANWDGPEGDTTAIFDVALAKKGRRAVLYNRNQSFACKTDEPE
jgi:hypothetical protein